MNRSGLSIILLSLLIAGLILFAPTGVNAQEPAVRAVLFHSPSCSHCKIIIEEILPPLQEKFRDQLTILMVDTSTDAGIELYYTMQDVYKPGDGRRGVPALIVGDVLLVGSNEIPSKFPAIIKSGLDGGGIDWPDLPGLENLLTDMPDVEQGTGGQSSEHETGGLNLDNIVALVVLAVLVGTLIANGYQLWVRRNGLLKPVNGQPSWIVPVLSVIGFYIAWYLANKEITNASVACGPLGGCDTVQNSAYAIFFGLPMGVWGMLAYAFIVVLWGMVAFGGHSPGKSNPGGFFDRLMVLVKPAMLAFSLFCVAFSTYLTILEAFVIKATCTWCIGSAIVSTIINWVVTLDTTWLPRVLQENGD